MFVFRHKIYKARLLKENLTVHQLYRFMYTDNYGYSKYHLVLDICNALQHKTKWCVYSKVTWVVADVSTFFGDVERKSKSTCNMRL